MCDQLSLFSVLLVLWGEIEDFQNITKEVGMDPVWTGKAKVKIPLPDGWGIGFEKRPFACLDDAVSSMISCVDPVIEKMKSVAISHKLTLEVTCEVQILDFVPLFDLFPQTMAWMTDLGATFFLGIKDPENLLD